MNMKLKYDAEADALSIQLRDGIYDESDEVAPNVIIDFDKERNPLAIEILQARQMLGGEVTLKLELSLEVSTKADTS